MQVGDRHLYVVHNAQVVEKEIERQHVTYEDIGMLEAFWASSCKGLWYRSYLCKRRGRGTDGPRKQARAAGRGDRLPKEHVGDRPRDADPPTTLLPKSRCVARTN